MPRVSRDVVESRPDEIVEACRQLYQDHTFHEITLKDISARTSLSRPSIYNYFATKEEIFLALLKKEYDQGGDIPGPAEEGVRDVGGRPRGDTRLPLDGRLVLQPGHGRGP